MHALRGSELGSTCGSLSFDLDMLFCRIHAIHGFDRSFSSDDNCVAGIAGIVVGIDFVSNVIDLQLLARRRRCIFLAPVVLTNIAGMIFRVGICR